MTDRVQVVYGEQDATDPASWKGRPYTYSTSEPLKVGDIVYVPPTPHTEVAQRATVVALGSDYDGDVQPVLRVIERPDQ